jgi:hypothetical protein
MVSPIDGLEDLEAVTVNADRLAADAWRPVHFTCNYLQLHNTRYMSITYADEHDLLIWHTEREFNRLSGDNYAGKYRKGAPH